MCEWLQVDEIFINSLKDAGLYDSIWQAFAVFLPVKTVGVQGDRRSHSNAVALRAITSEDGMTADWYTRFLRIHLCKHMFIQMAANGYTCIPHIDSCIHMYVDV